MRNPQSPGSLKGPFPKMLLGGKYLRRVDSPQGENPMQAEVETDSDNPFRLYRSRGNAPVTQPPWRFDGNQFQFDFRNGLLQ